MNRFLINTFIHPLLACELGLLLSLGCASPKESAVLGTAETQPQSDAQPDPLLDSATVTPPESAPRSQNPGKIEAPVEVRLTVDQKTAKVTAILEVTATKDVQRCTVRFVLPAGVLLTEGDAHGDLGALSMGQSVKRTIVLQVGKSVHQPLTAGVDVYMSDKLKLNKSVSTPLGTQLSPGPKTEIIPASDGQDAVRVQRLQ